jgi:hypothetical protein
MNRVVCYPNSPCGNVSLPLGKKTQKEILEDLAKVEEQKKAKFEGTAHYVYPRGEIKVTRLDYLG